MLLTWNLKWTRMTKRLPTGERVKRRLAEPMSRAPRPRLNFARGGIPSQVALLKAGIDWRFGRQRSLKLAHGQALALLLAIFLECCPFATLTNKHWQDREAFYSLPQTAPRLFNWLAFDLGSPTLSVALRGSLSSSSCTGTGPVPATLHVNVQKCFDSLVKSCHLRVMPRSRCVLRLHNEIVPSL